MVTGGIDYSESWSKPRLDILRVLDETVGAVFPWRRVWAGNKVFLVASRKKITADWWDYHARVLQQNQFVREDLFSVDGLQGQISEVEKLLEVQVSKNTRVRPVLFQLALKDMSDFWDIELYWFAIVVGLLLIVGLLFFRESARGVFLSGIVLGGMQVVLLLYWQLVMGDLFRATGLLFSFFMAGLAVGALLGHRNIAFFRARYFPVLLIALSVLVISAVPVLDIIGHSWFFPVAVFFLIFTLSVLGGAVFVAGVSLHTGTIQKAAALVYGADVAGGAIGSFLAAVFLVPYAGLVNAGYLLGMAVLIGGLMLFKRF
jgi:spermidine synthase